MKKKVSLLNQTQKLSSAKFGFMLRDTKKRRLFDAWRNCTSVEEFQQYCEQEGLAEAEIEALMRNVGNTVLHNQAPAVQEVAWWRVFCEKVWPKAKDNKYSPEDIKKIWRQGILDSARNILDMAVSIDPIQTLLVGIDLSRSKEAILAELEEVLDQRKTEYEFAKGHKDRLKWLPIVNELFEVFDLWSTSGQTPGQASLKAIAQKVGRPLSTVNSQWLKAHELIYGTPYDPKAKIATEASQKTAEELCAQCPHGGKCYRSGDWIPCPDYKKLQGRMRQMKTVSFNEGILYD